MENTIGTGKMAQLFGVTVKALQRWKRDGKLVPAGRTGFNRRRYRKSLNQPLETDRAAGPSHQA